MQLGTLASIRRYPVKSLPADVLDACAVGPEGLEGDRIRAFVVRAGHSREGKTYRGKEHDRLHLTHERDVADLVRERGVEVELERDDELRFMDDAPVSLILDRWLDGVSAYAGYRVEYERFRPNLFVHAREGVAVTEPDLTGRELQVGEVAMRVRYPIERCVVTTYDPSGGPPDPRILAYVAQARSAWMGVYCDVLRAGTVRIGDSLELVER
jgi:uncharacterized protein YcbX